MFCLLLTASVLDILHLVSDHEKFVHLAGAVCGDRVFNAELGCFGTQEHG